VVIITQLLLLFHY